MIHVIATIELNSASDRDAFLQAFKANVPNVLAEKGCVAYAPVIDVDSGLAAQGDLRDDTVTVVEQWDDLQCLHDHIAAPHMATYREQVKGLVRSVSLAVKTDA